MQQTPGTGPNYAAMIQDGQRGIQTKQYGQMAMNEYRDYNGGQGGAAQPLSGMLGGSGPGTNVGGQQLGGQQPGGIGGFLNNALGGGQQTAGQQPMSGGIGGQQQPGGGIGGFINSAMHGGQQPGGLGGAAPLQAGAAPQAGGGMGGLLGKAEGLFR